MGLCCAPSGVKNLEFGGSHLRGWLISCTLPMLRQWFAMTASMAVDKRKGVHANLK